MTVVVEVTAFIATWAAVSRTVSLGSASTTCATRRSFGTSPAAAQQGPIDASACLQGHFPDMTFRRQLSQDGPDWDAQVADTRHGSNHH